MGGFARLTSNTRTPKAVPQPEHQSANIPDAFAAEDAEAEAEAAHIKDLLERGAFATADRAEAAARAGSAQPHQTGQGEFLFTEAELAG